MHDMTAFERRFAERLQAELATPGGPIDPAAIASAAIGARTIRDRILLRLGLGGALPLPATTRRGVLLLIAAGLVIVTLALVVGAKQGGPRLAFFRTNGDVVVANGDGSNARVIGQWPFSPLRNELVWAPGGEHLATFGEDWRLTVLRVDGTVLSSRQLDDRFSRFAWSPDGTQLAIYDGAWSVGANGDGPTVIKPHLDVIDLDGRVAWSATLPADFYYTLAAGYLAWSPDGRTIAITGILLGDGVPDQRSNLWLVDVETKTVRQLVEGEGRQFDDQPTWRPDGRLVFARLNDGLWQADVATGAVAQLLEVPPPPCEVQCGQPSRVTILGLSPDGSRLAWSAAGQGLSILDLATGVVVHPANTSRPLRATGPARWSADGRSFLILTSEPVTPLPPADPAGPLPDRLTRIDIETGEFTVLATEVVAFATAE